MVSGTGAGRRQEPRGRGNNLRRVLTSREPSSVVRWNERRAGGPLSFQRTAMRSVPGRQGAGRSLPRPLVAGRVEGPPARGLFATPAIDLGVVAAEQDLG